MGENVTRVRESVPCTPRIPVQSRVPGPGLVPCLSCSVPAGSSASALPVQVIRRAGRCGTMRTHFNLPSFEKGLIQCSGRLNGIFVRKFDVREAFRMTAELVHQNRDSVH